MEWITCTSCGSKVGPLATYCPNCGAKLPDLKNPVDPDEQAEHNLQLCNPEMHLFQKYYSGHAFCTVCGRSIFQLQDEKNEEELDQLLKDSLSGMADWDEQTGDV